MWTITQRILNKLIYLMMSFTIEEEEALVHFKDLKFKDLKFKDLRFPYFSLMNRYQKLFFFTHSPPPPFEEKN